jgi:hypothetical protein
MHTLTLAAGYQFFGRITRRLTSIFRLDRLALTAIR